MDVKDGKIDFESLTHKVAEVRKVQDAVSGLTSDFYNTPAHCKLLNDGVKRAKIIYSYIPLDIDIEEACGEVSMISGMYEQSVMYSDRFKQDMRTAVRKKGEIRVRPRRWY